MKFVREEAGVGFSPPRGTRRADAKRHAPRRRQSEKPLYHFKEITCLEVFADGSCYETTILENGNAGECFGCLGKALSNSINPVVA
ncbi:MAG TPA: hypothetical protein VF532_00250 [Candidatus Angelobacter sp.]